jgi:hypothetical protein
MRRGARLARLAQHRTSWSLRPVLLSRTLSTLKKDRPDLIGLTVNAQNDQVRPIG